MSGKFTEVHQRSLDNPEEFWAEAAQLIDWYKKWDRVFDDNDAPFCEWFPGGELNTCFNALDRHVEAGNGDRTALISTTISTMHASSLVSQFFMSIELA